MNTLQKLLVLLCIVPGFSANAKLGDTASRRNVVFAELGGPAGYYSFGYQRKFDLTRNFGITAGGYVTPFMLYRWTREGYAYSPRVGAQAQLMYSAGRHEIGLGPTLTYYAYYYHKSGEYQKPLPAIFAQLSYGYTFRNNLYVGIAFTLQFVDNGYTEFVPWGGLRIGYRF